MNHKSNFLILGCKFLCSQLEPEIWTAQTLGFSLGDVLPGLYCKSLRFLLVFEAFPLQFCLQQVKSTLDQTQVSWLTLLLYNFPLLCLKKILFGCFGIALLLIVHLHREALFLLFPLLWYKLSFIPSVHRMVFQKLDGVSRCCCLANSSPVFEAHRWFPSCGEPSVVPQDVCFLLIVDVVTPPPASMEMALDLANCCEDRERTLPSTSAVFRGLPSPSSLVRSFFLRTFQTVDTANDSAVSLMGLFWFVSI